MDLLRDTLYPLGFIANILFASRFTIQWFVSEYKKESVVGANFWVISLMGNIMMAFHTFIQLQLNICLIQTFNAVISWRNLDLRKPEEEQFSLKSVLIFIACSLLFVFGLFVLQGWLTGNYVFFRSPSYFTKGTSTPLSAVWHIFGTIGFALFASRFWVQWWQSEMAHASVVKSSFWWLSIAGAIMACIYFFMLNDLVNFIGPALGLLPYIRNLVLLKKKQVAVEMETHETK